MRFGTSAIGFYSFTGNVTGWVQTSVTELPANMSLVGTGAATDGRLQYAPGSNLLGTLASNGIVLFERNEFGVSLD